MKKKNLMKKLATISLVTVLAASLTACGQKELSPSEARDELREQEMAKVIPLSEAFAEEGIWFYYNYADRDKTITKDDYVRGGILQFDGKGNATYYDFMNADGTFTFAELNDLSDEEIITKAKELTSQASSNSQSNYIDELDEKIAEVSSWLDEVKAVENEITEDKREAYNEERAALQAQYDELIEEKNELQTQKSVTPTAIAFELHIETDGTGNNTASEKLVVGDKTFNFNTALSNQVVFDSIYSGVVRMENSWFDGCLVKKVEEGHPGFRLDTPDTKGVKVD